MTLVNSPIHICKIETTSYPSFQRWTGGPDSFEDPCMDVLGFFGPVIVSSYSIAVEYSSAITVGFIQIKV